MAASFLAGLALLAMLLAGCHSAPESDPGVALSLKAQRICRERLAELPPASTPRQTRQAYARCLRSLGEKPAAIRPAGTGTGPGGSSAPDVAASASAPRYTCYTTFAGDTEIGAGFAAGTPALLFENSDGAWRLAPGVAATPELTAHAADLDGHREELGLFWIAGEHPPQN